MWQWMQTLGSDKGPTRDTLDEILEPGRRQLQRETDEDLLELIGARPNSREGQIAASIMRTREAWRTPARWSVIISLLAFGLSVAAFVRTM